jgi:hypothetical protein
VLGEALALARKRQERKMPWFGNQHSLADAALQQHIGLSMKDLEPVLQQGGDPAERKFMECCRCLWKVDGVQLLEPFVDAFFNKLPETSRNVLFQRMVTIVYVAQDLEIKPTKS